MNFLGLLMIGLPPSFVLITLCKYLISGKRLFSKLGVNLVLESLIVIAYPLMALIFLDLDVANDCCSDGSLFSPDHRISVYVLIVICILAYYYSRLRMAIAPPFLELVINSILVTAVVLNILIGIHLIEPIFVFTANAPIIVLYALALADNQKRILEVYFPNLIEQFEDPAEQFAINILFLDPILKYPVLMFIALPLLIILSGFLLIFGQKPDAIILAFTQTYKHGFSQLDYLCDNVNCGGHFLCSVAAKGHKGLVKPQRLGIRAGQPIICNRQLLIANAFEELIEQRLPKLHRSIRKNYNQVGEIVHRYYGIFNIKWIADLIYILMKPLEWIFLLVLYTFDHKPENRIAQQYMKWEERAAIKDQILNSQINTSK